MKVKQIPQDIKNTSYVDKFRLIAFSIIAVFALPLFMKIMLKIYDLEQLTKGFIILYWLFIFGIITAVITFYVLRYIKKNKKTTETKIINAEWKQ